MLKSSLIVYKIKFHEKRLEEAADDPKEMGYHKFMIHGLERQEKARIAALPWANAGQILHKEFKRDWTEEELKEFNLEEI
jgi:hypothetical protein